MGLGRLVELTQAFDEVGDLRLREQGIRPLGSDSREWVFVESTRVEVARDRELLDDEIDEHVLAVCETGCRHEVTERGFGR